MARCTIQTRALSIDGDRETRTYRVADEGGYVREVMPDGDMHQVSEDLGCVGTMMLSSGDRLASDVRRALARIRRDRRDRS